MREKSERGSGSAGPSESIGAERLAASERSEPTAIEEDLYSPEAVSHFTEPRNVGGLQDPDGKGTDSNPTCGDRTTITVRLRDGRIDEVRFRTFGCVAAIASASVLTELVLGRSIDDARQIPPTAVIDALGGLPARKEGCALMAVGALRAALVDAQVRTEATT